MTALLKIIRTSGSPEHDELLSQMGIEFQPSKYVVVDKPNLNIIIGGNPINVDKVSGVDMAEGSVSSLARGISTATDSDPLLLCSLNRIRSRFLSAIKQRDSSVTETTTAIFSVGGKTSTPVLQRITATWPIQDRVDVLNASSMRKPPQCSVQQSRGPESGSA